MKKLLAECGAWCIVLHKPMKKNLAHFRSMTRENVATLPGNKTIMRVTTTKTVQWWLVLPAIGCNDNPCILLRKVNKVGSDSFFPVRDIQWHEPKIIQEEMIRASQR